MIEFIKNNKRDTLILFVHGFTGGKETWMNTQHGYFFDQLSQFPSIEENFDIATFEYFTKLSSLFVEFNSNIGRLKSLFTNIQTKSKKNISIEDISALLSTQIRFALAAYDNIIVVAHSMGGLVTKACILNDLRQGQPSKIKLFISLAVPHLGANLATYGKLLSNNKQINDLAPLSELCPTMNNEWVKYNLKPGIKYFYGMYDDIVTKESAIGTDNLPQDTIACNDDHLSISRPGGVSSIAITAIKQFLDNFLHQRELEAGLTPKRLVDPSQYRDETFVLKLMLADVHNAAVKHSKEHFLNAEYARKLFSSAADQERLRTIYDRIRTLYQNCYENFVSRGGDSTLLVNEVHQKIVLEDANYLKTAFPMLQGLHKMGMLHQIANDLQDDVWWSENQSIEALETLKVQLEKNW
ncbi:ABC-three component system protein [Burkholderia sp. Leaf177]|uniref:ABC-three component system protein n=1 Tax=Burkholderia sp. Leaf177 TaxID=1736287 RepID=UPI000B26CEAA|nr:ABC-three component system protein [Burkholderia sp. Leaf177]